MNQAPIRTLLLDDDDYYRHAMAATLRVTFGFEVDEAADSLVMMQQLVSSGGEYDVILIDQHLTGGTDGITVLSEIRQAYPEIECIILTGYAPEDRERAIAAGAFRYVEKLYANHNELALLIRAAAQQAKMRAVSRDILSQLERKDVLGRILDAVVSMLEVDSAAIALHDKEAGRWEWICLPVSSSDQEECHALINDRLADEIYRSQRPVSTLHLEGDSHYESLAQLGLASAAAAAVTATPMPEINVTLGVLFAYSRRPGHFDADRLALLQSLVTSAGLALDNAQTFQKTSDLAAYMEALHDTNLQLAQTTDQTTLLELAWQFVNTELQVAGFFVALYDSETDEVSFPAMWDEHVSASQPPFVLANDNSLTAHVIRIGEERYWATSDEKVQYCQSANIVSRPGGSGRQCDSCLFFPLRIGGRVIGVMSVQAYEPYAFPIEFRVACRALSNQLAAALENARLMREVSRKATDLATLQTLSIDIASSLDMKTVGEQTCAAAVRFFEADHSGLVLFAEDYRTGRVAAEYPPGNALDLEISLEEVPDEQALIRKRVPLIIERVVDRETLGSVRAILLELGIQATLIVPVVAAGRLLGSFSVDFHRHHHFGEHDVDNARMFAAQVAVALDHARYFQDAVRSASQVRLLHKISDLIQTADEPEDIFHMVLTGVTADFGLRFNAAALLLCEGDELVGRIGVGHFTKKEAEADWLQDEELQHNDFSRYYERLRLGEFSTSRTPLDRAVRNLRLPRHETSFLSEIIANPTLTIVEDDGEHRLPQPFVDAFRPAFPLAVAPLLTRGRVIGLMVADNRFTEHPITSELRDSLLGFADTAAVAIDNSELQLETKRRLDEANEARRDAESQAETNARLVRQRERVWSKATAVAASVAQEELETTLKAIAESSREALEADVVTVYAYDNQAQCFTDLGYSITHQRTSNSIRPPDELPSNSVLYDIVHQDAGSRYRVHDVAHPDFDLMRGEFVKSEEIEASVALQLRGREGQLGIMFVNYRSPHDFKEDELASIQHFADQAAAAIYSQQQYRHATRRAHILEALNYAARFISGAGTLEATLEQIALQALKVTDAINEGAACHVALKRGDRLRFAAASSSHVLTRLQDEVGTIWLDSEDRVGIIGRVALTGASINSPDASTHPDYIEFEKGTKSQLAVPIKSGTGDVIGVINLEHPSQHYFSQEDTGTLESLAALAAAAIQNAQHLDQKEIVAKISARVNASRTLDEFLDSLFEQLVGVFDRRGVPVFPNLGLYEPETEQLKMIETKHFPRSGHANYIGLEEHGIIPLVARIGDSYYAEDVVSDPNYYQVREKTRSEFATPVVYDDRLLAVLDLESPVRNAFNSDDIELLETLAHQVATTIHNVNQYEVLQRTQAASSAQTAIIYMNMVTNQWNHRIRNQAQTIVEQTKKLERDLRPLPIDKTKISRRLEMIARNAEEIKRKPTKEPLDQELGVHRFVANELLRDTIAKLTRGWPQKERESRIAMSVNCLLQDDEKVAVSREWFEIVMDHVLQNALRAIAEETEPKIEIGTRLAGNMVEMYLADNGSGIPDHIRTQLLSAPVAKREDEPGLGMGLFITRMIMETYQGKIRITPSLPHGTIVTLSFPREYPILNPEPSE